MRKILAIGGAVIKTARNELIERIKADEIEMLIHNGGSIFHDFQIGRQEVDVNISTSYPLSQLINGFEVNKPTSDHIWRWLDDTDDPPDDSATTECLIRGIPVLVFTALGADFWQMFGNDWELYAKKSQEDFSILRFRMDTPFHFINMGSAVIHPEVFLKAVALSQAKNFRADVVDFLDMYRPKTRVACYGKYYQCEHTEFFKMWRKGEINEFIPSTS